VSDHFLRDDKGRCHTIITMANIYVYEGFTFEFHHFCGPSKLKKNWEPAAREGRKFYAMIGRWQKLSKKQKEATRIAG